MKQKTDKKKIKLLPVLFSIIILFLIIISFKIHYLSENFISKTDILYDEVIKNNEMIDLLKQNILLLSNNTNELCSIAGLPQQNYISLMPEEINTQENNLPYFRAFDILLDNYIQSENIEYFDAFLKSYEFESLINEYDFAVTSAGTVSVILKKHENEYFNVFCDNKSIIHIKSYLNREINIISFSKELKNFIKKETTLINQHYINLKSLLTDFNSLTVDEDILNYLYEHKLHFSKLNEDASKYYFAINQENGQSKLNINLNKKSVLFSIKDKEYKNINSLKSGIIKILDSIDLRTSEQIIIDFSKKKIADIQNDNSFITLLSSKNLTFEKIPREDNDYFYYDIIYNNGNSIGSIAIQKLIGEIYLMDKDDVTITSIKTIGRTGSSLVKKN